MSLNKRTIAVVIPCYKVKKHILQVLKEVPEFIDRIYVCDDKCPEKSGNFVLENATDPRIKIIYNQINLGVGGAVCAGYREALSEKIEIIIKLDGDGQMDPGLIEELIQPLLVLESDYVKGNRFHTPSSLAQMPGIRIFGNSGLSFINKLVTGYWEIMDPTNGFTAISYEALKTLPLEKIERRYFFECDMLFRLSINEARVTDFYMNAKYSDEVSNLSVKKTLVEFPPKFLKRFFKRLFYQYFLRDFNFGSVALITGIPFLGFGSIYGMMKYYEYTIVRDIPAPTGSVVIPSLLIILGTQFLISFLQYDINSYPKTSLSSKKVKYVK